MSKLQELIQKLCPDGVEYKKIETLFDTFNGMVGVTNKWKETGNCVFIDYLNVYNNMSVDVNKLQNATVKSFQQNTLKKGDILLTSASETPDECALSSVIRDDIVDNVFLDDHLFAIRLKEEFCDNVNTAYVNYYMHTPAFRAQVCKRVRGVTRFYITGKPFISIEIPVPPLEIQKKIVEYLDNFTNLAAELQAELQARQEQYEYYRNKLLTFNELNGVGQSVTWMKMSEIGTFIRGNGLQKKDFTESGVPCIHYGQIYTHYGTFVFHTKSFVNEETAKKCKKAHSGDLIIASTSENVKDVGKAVAWLGDEDLVISNHTFIFSHNQNPVYLSYMFQSNLFVKYKKTKAIGVKVIDMPQKSLENFCIPIPSLAEQEYIVSILDKFETLVNDLTQGLPAEIEARQQQYEYYRDQLLTFKRKEA